MPKAPPAAPSGAAVGAAAENGIADCAYAPVNATYRPAVLSTEMANRETAIVAKLGTHRRRSNTSGR